MGVMGVMRCPCSPALQTAGSAQITLHCMCTPVQSGTVSHVSIHSNFVADELIYNIVTDHPRLIMGSYSQAAGGVKGRSRVCPKYFCSSLVTWLGSSLLCSNSPQNDGTLPPEQ